MWRSVLFVFAIVSSIPQVLAQDGAKVYKKVAPSVVWIHSTRDRGLATGSGTLIDKEKRLVLTNYHVVQDNPNAKVFFPVMRDGQPIAEKEYYVDRLRRLAISGKVIAVNKSVDLAIIRIDSVPEKVEAVSLAAASPDPGAAIHSIGSAGKSGALFGYVKGTVRQVYHKDWKAELAPGKVASFSAKVIETDSPTNPGDSGGPLLNDKGELVGVTQGGAINASLVSYFIDLSEVKKLLNSQGVRTVAVDKPVAKIAREKPLAILDSAKMFSPEAIKQASDDLAELFKKDIDLMVETYPSAPADRVESLRKASPAERTAYFKEWTRNRMHKEDVRGFAILICSDPKSMFVDISPDVISKFPDKFELKIRDAVVDGLKNNKPDDALKNAVKMIREQMGKK